MQYSPAQIAKILNKIIAKARHELEIASEQGTVDEVMAEYGVTLEEGAMPVSKQTSKILVFGALSGKVSDYQMVAKKMGIQSDNIEFAADYHKLKHFNTTILRDSMEYSDIIFGPAPHKIEGMGDTYSLVAAIEREPEHYPRLIKAVANEKLKITITNFKESLRKTRYFESSY